MASADITPECLAWLRLARSENVGPITFYQLLDVYGSAQEALQHLPDLAAKGGRAKKIQITTLNEAEQEIAQHQKIGAQLIFSTDPHYPKLLKEIPDAPPVLSILGNPKLLDQQALAIVGARNASLNGKRFAEKLATDLGQQSWVIVSGLARGIDTHAHQGALSTGTIAVLAGGVDHIYPPENQALYTSLQEKGAILSEAPLGITPKSHFFPRRNRIISGLCKGVIVVEAAHKSGSLITARYALDQGREVFAVPGSPYDPRHRGCNSLITQGATLIQNANDVLHGMGQPQMIKPTESPKIKLKNKPSITHKDRTIVEENLSPTPVGVDELARQCHICPEELLCIILELELAGKVRRTSGNRVALAVE